MRALVLALLAVLAGCGPSLAEVAAPYRFEVLAQVVRARVIGELAAVHPRVTADEVMPGEDPAQWATTGDSGDRVWIRLEDLRALPDYAASAPWRRTSIALHDCGALALYGRDPVDLGALFVTVRQTCGKWAERTFAECPAPRGLAVIRLHEFVEPAPAGCPKQEDAPCTFHGGRAAGDVLLYDFARQRYVGGMPFSAESSPQLPSRTTPNELMDDLHVQTRSAIGSALRKHGGPKPAEGPP